MTRTRSLYFTVTVFTTVGFGDIVARIDPSRVLVLIQMLLNLVVLGVVIKVLFTAGSRGMERKRRGDDRRWFAAFIPLPKRPSDDDDPDPPEPASDPTAVQ